MKRATKIIKSTKRSRKKASIQYADSHTQGSLKEIIESLYRYFTRNSSGMKDFIGNLEREILIRALLQFDGSQKQASKFLRLKQSTMCTKYKKYGIIFKIEPTLFAENPRKSRKYTLDIPEEKSQMKYKTSTL
jgi:DNA-binding NtrC family response regulator